MATDLFINQQLNELVNAVFQSAMELKKKGSFNQPKYIGKLLLLEDPVQIDQVTKKTNQFRKNFSLLDTLGNSRFNADGDEWEIRRSLTQPNYIQAAKPSNERRVLDIYAHALEKCRATPDQIDNALFEASMIIFFDAFGIKLSTNEFPLLIDRLRNAMRRLQFYSWIAPNKDEEKELLLVASKILKEFEKELLAENSRSKLMNRFEKQAQGVDRFSPIEEFMINFFAGVETTIATLNWIINCLASNGDVQNRIYDEIQIGEETIFLECMINETMRNFPPIPFVVRETTSEIEVGKIVIPKNHLVMLSIVGAHRHPDFWSNPNEFDSSRKEFIENTFDRRSFIPFLTGPRMCGGARLARLEIVTAIRLLIKQFVFSREDDLVGFDYGLALRPDKSANIRVKRRQI